MIYLVMSNDSKATQAEHEEHMLLVRGLGHGSLSTTRRIRLKTKYCNSKD